MQTTNYTASAAEAAQDTAKEYIDTIIEKLMDDEDASDDLSNDYGNGDSYHHETHVDDAYSLTEAAALLDQLSDHIETDSGLWDSQEPRDAISTQAAYTYGNAVMSGWQEIIESINDDDDVKTLRGMVAELGNFSDTEWEARFREFIKAAMIETVTEIINAHS